MWKKWIARGVSAYGVALVLMLFVRAFVGDRSPLLFAATSLLLLGFLPAPALLVAGVTLGRRRFLALFLGALGVWVWLWGGLFLPRSAPRSSQRTLSALSYNALGYNFDTSDTLRV